MSSTLAHERERRAWQKIHPLAAAMGRIMVGMEASRETTTEKSRASAKRRATKQRRLAYGLSGNAEERKSRIRSILAKHSETIRRLGA